MDIAARKWTWVGKATVEANGEVRFPAPPEFRPECVVENTNARGPKEGKVPGIYRLTFEKDDNKYYWIGKTKDLRRCPFIDYRNPVDGVERDNVVHDILVDAGGAVVEVIPECDLGTTRHKAERQEQENAIGKDELLLNTCKTKCGLGHGHYLKFEVEYYRKMLDKTSLELKTWNTKYPLHTSTTSSAAHSVTT